MNRPVQRFYAAEGKDVAAPGYLPNATRTVLLLQRPQRGIPVSPLTSVHSGKADNPRTAGIGPERTFQGHSAKVRFGIPKIKVPLFISLRAIALCHN